MFVINNDMVVSKFKSSILKEYLLKNTDLSDKDCINIVNSIKNQLYKKYDDDCTIQTNIIKSLLLSNLIKRNKEDINVDNNIVLGMTVNDFEDLLKGSNNSNANHFKTAEQIHHYANESVTKQYALNIMPRECKESYLEGRQHIHDLANYCTKSNCMNYDIRWFIRNGLKIDGKGHHGSVAKSAKSLKVLLNHMLQVFMAGACCLSGGQSFSHFNTFLAPLCKGLSYDKIKQEIQGFIYNCNMSLLSRGGQLCFTSINLNLTIPKYLRNVSAISTGGVVNGVYADYQNEFDMIFKAVCEVLEDGDGNGNFHRFPNVICVIEDKDEVKDYKGNLRTFIELSNKNGFVYFANNTTSDKEIGTYMGCFSGKEKVMIKKDDEIITYTFDELITEYMRGQYGVCSLSNKNIFVRSIDDNYNVIWAKIHKLIHNEPRALYKVYLNNGKSFVCDDNHTFITPSLDKINCLESIGKPILIINSKLEIKVGSVTCIKLYDYADSYCVEANDRVIIGDKPYNFILTGNCRTSMKNNYTGDWEKDCLNTGNFMYNTINLPLLSMIAKENTNDIVKEFYKVLDNECEIVYKSLKHRLEQVKKSYYDYGLADFLVNNYDKDTGEPLYDFDKLSLSIGYVGLNECLFNLFDGDVVEYEDDGVKIIEYLNKKKEEFIKRDGLRWSVIGSASENCCYTLAKKTLEAYPNSAYNGTVNNPYFTNSSHINVKSNQSISKQIINASKFHNISLAGHILHLWLGEAFSDTEALYHLIQKIIYKTNVRFWDFNKDYFVCFKCGYKVGTVDNIEDYDNLICPVCKSNDCEVYSRVTGYFTPVSSFNDGKFEEFKDRFRL